MGKLALFRAVLQADFVILAVMAILTVIISIYYYMKVVVAMYMNPATADAAVPGADPGARLAGAVVLVLILWLGLAPSTLFTLLARLAAALPFLS